MAASSTRSAPAGNSIVDAPKHAWGATVVLIKKAFLCNYIGCFCISLAVRTAASTLFFAMKLLGCAAEETSAPSDFAFSNYEKGSVFDP